MEDSAEEKTLARLAEEMTMVDAAEEGTMAEQEIHTEEPAEEETTVVWRSMMEISGPLTMAKAMDWKTEAEPKEVETKVEP